MKSSRDVTLRILTDHEVTFAIHYDVTLVYGLDSDDDADERYGVAKRLANAMADDMGPVYHSVDGHRVISFDLRDTNDDEELKRLRLLEKRVRQRCKEAVPGWAPELRELLS